MNTPLHNLAFYGGGSGGGTSDYESLKNRPQINGTTLSGNKTGAALGLADLASPALTGTPTAPTASAGTNTTQIATTAFTQNAVDNVQSVFVTITLAAASWSNNQQTVTVSGVLSDETAQLIQPVPASASRAAYEAAAVRATAQAVDSITFDCQSPAPVADLTVYVVITPLGGAS